MIQLSNSTAQALQPGQSMTFNTVIVKPGRRCGVCWNKQAPNTVKLCQKGNYDITFHGNITGAAGDQLQLAMALGGYPVATTAMNAKPAAEGDLWNVSGELLVRNCCCDLDRVSVVNAGSTPITIAPNASIIVREVNNCG